jgi:hypothetical protein
MRGDMLQSSSAYRLPLLHPSAVSFAARLKPAVKEGPGTAVSVCARASPVLKHLSRGWECREWVWSGQPV